MVAAASRLVWLVAVGREGDVSVKTGDLTGQDVRNDACQESEPPYERRSGVTPVEQRAVGKWKGRDHETRRTIRDSSREG
jgi:hypothetical protein